MSGERKYPMATVTELRKMAHDLYARAQASHNPFSKQKLRKSADDYLEEAEHLRRTQRPSLRVIDGSKGDDKEQTKQEPPDDDRQE
jgi:hypothetical protein